MAASLCERWSSIELIITSGNLRPALEDMLFQAVFFPRAHGRDRIAKMMYDFIRALRS